MKKNNFLSRIEHEKQIALEMRTRFTLQMSIDAALIAASEVFGLGEKRAKVFMDKFADVYNKMAHMALEDARCDKEIAYTKAKVDERLKEICGDNFCPWEERYM